MAGAEAELVADFLQRSDQRWGGSVVVAEMPLGGGVADLVRVKWATSDPMGELAEVSALASLPDRYLYLLASLDPDRDYRTDGAASVSRDLVAVEVLCDGGFLLRDGTKVWRPHGPVDRIEQVIAYEFKIRRAREGLRQAALRRRAATRAYLVTPETIGRSLPARTEFTRLGVGLISLGDRLAHRIAAVRGTAPRWAKFLVVRGMLRGLEREVASH